MLVPEISCINQPFHSPDLTDMNSILQNLHKNYVSTILTNKSKNASEQIIKAVTGCITVMSPLPPPHARTHTHHAGQTTARQTRTCSSSHMESITKYMLTFVTDHCCLLQSRPSSIYNGSRISDTAGVPF